MSAGEQARGAAGGRGAAVTAQEILDRLKQQLAAAGVAWRAETVDTVKFGDPSTVVTGVATTFMATFDAIKQAVTGGANLVITHEPTFYNHQDVTASLTADPTFAAKRAFLTERRVVIFRFHDHWHAHRPDGMRVALLRALDWPDTGGVLVRPPTTLRNLALEIDRRLGVRALRVVGPPDAKVSRVAIGLGYGNPPLQAGTDVVITGESQEADSAWDNAAYAIDAIDVKQPKGLILLGHERSEALGMDECAAWLRTFVSEVPISFIRPGEPFWSPS